MKKIIVMLVMTLVLLQSCVMIYATRENLNGMVYENETRIEYHTDK